MSAATNHPLVPGAYAATLTFFSDDESVDIESLRTHITRLARAGLSGIVVLGSNGEAAHLSDDQKYLVTSTVRHVLDDTGFEQMPVIAGTSAQSAQECIRLCKHSAKAGASHVLVLPPSYYKAAMSPDIIFDFYQKVANNSPLPVIIYSFPAVAGDINLSSDLILRISQHPNVIGTKFTCGDCGKLARVAREMNASTPGHLNHYWAVGGLADFTLPALVAGGSGVIAGGANLAPRLCVKIIDLFQKGHLREAMGYQAVLSQGDWVHTAAGIGATKALVQHHFHYGGAPRHPLQLPSTEALQALVASSSEMMEVEASLSE
ncbi:aldolase, partial [Aureobasidium melanogenum]